MLGLAKYIVSFSLIIFLVNSVVASDRKFNLGQIATKEEIAGWDIDCLLYTSPSPRDKRQSRMPSSA